LRLGHHRPQGLAERNDLSLADKIGLGGLVAPWTRWKRLLARSLVFSIYDHSDLGCAILDAGHVGCIA
jgi:hypothetical protein